MDFLNTSWPWYIGGPIIAVVMILLIIQGKNFGMSANFRTICSIGGAGKVANFFRFDWKKQNWNLIVLVGTIIGGGIASILFPTKEIELGESTTKSLESMGISNKESYIPQEFFSAEALESPLVLSLLIIGGFLVGFGARYAGGCTSGHAISGLSNLQKPSLIAVIGFFIGGLIMTHFLLPILFTK